MPGSKPTRRNLHRQTTIQRSARDMKLVATQSRAPGRKVTRCPTCGQKVWDFSDDPRFCIKDPSWTKT